MGGPKHTTGPTVTDLFCGAGGSSQGLVAAGASLVIAANHWDLAVASHQENFPDADHDTANISQADPRRYPRTDILWASPECTNHSQAKGRKRTTGQLAFGEEPLPDEAAERSRATMWDVVRFAEHHRYPVLLVENVVDAGKWVLIDAWRKALSDIGYHVHEVYLNSMHAHGKLDGAPQSRDRMYWVAHRRSLRCPDLELRPVGWCPRCATERECLQAWKNPTHRWGRYRAQYLYVCRTCGTPTEPYAWPAARAIDWTLPGERIGDRARPLAPKTLARIEAGIRKYAHPVHLDAAGNTFERPGYHRSWSIEEPLKTLHTTMSKAFAYPPLMVPVEGRDGKGATSVEEAMRTQTARNETGLAVPPMLVPAGRTWNDSATPADEPMRTRTSRDTEAVVVPPFLTVHRGEKGGEHRTGALVDPMPTMTASGNHLGVVTPPFIAELRGGGSDHRPVADPMSTVCASGGHHGLVQHPGFVMRNNGSRGDGGEHNTPLTEPLRTLTTGGHQSLVTWAALYAYDGGQLRSPLAPLPTQTTVEGDALLEGAGLPAVEDCLFRMLEPHEIGAGMAFAGDYIVLGNKRERVRQYGNAVTPPAAALLFERVGPLLTEAGR